MKKLVYINSKHLPANKSVGDIVEVGDVLPNTNPEGAPQLVQVQVIPATPDVSRSPERYPLVMQRVDDLPSKYAKGPFNASLLSYSMGWAEPVLEAVSKKLTITIELGNEAFQPDPTGEVLVILIGMVQKLRDGELADLPLRVIDTNGNPCGTVTLS